MVGVHMRYHNITEATQWNAVLEEFNISAFWAIVNEIVLGGIFHKDAARSATCSRLSRYAPKHSNLWDKRRHGFKIKVSLESFKVSSSQKLGSGHA